MLLLIADEGLEILMSCKGLVTMAAAASDDTTADDEAAMTLCKDSSGSGFRLAIRA